MTEHDDIRIGTLAGKHTRTADYIRQIARHGFESFQINFHKGFPAGFDLRKTACDVMIALEQTGGAAVVSSLAIYGNPIEEKKIADDLRRAIDLAHLFGPACNVVAGFAGCLTGRPIPDAIKPFKKTWAPLARRAADRGLRIAFENCPMGGTWSRASWNIAINPAAWELMFNELPADNLGLEWEPCHQMCQLIDPIPQLRRWVGKIFHVHGKDATVHQDLLRTHGIHAGQAWAQHRHPGFGDSNWTDIISILRLAKWRGSIDIEGWHDPVYRDDLEMTGQVHALNYLKRCRGGPFVPNPV
jgi:sugar phosphate isomerase/epimerase